MAAKCNSNNAGLGAGNAFKAALLAASVLLASCAGKGRPLMPAPNLYTQANAPQLFTDLPDELKTGKLDLLYVTDRAPEYDDSGQLIYGHGRSRSAAFGSAVVELKPQMSWESLEKVSVERDRSVDLKLELVSTVELGRFQETPSRVVIIDGQPQPHPDDVQASQIASEEFRREILRRLARAPRDEILLFVHGYNNHFDDAALTLAEIWHYLGREQVPLLYTWPAGRGGASGYIYDRESGEFTIHHLKNLIRELASIPEIEAFQLIAHSRGTDVMTSAVRELTLTARAAGYKDNPFDDGRSHLVLAAPDLDMDVVSQRLIAEQLWRENRNITIYTYRSDKAIGMAERFFKSVKRIGRLGVEDIPQIGLDSIEQIDGVSIVEMLEIDDAKASHSYFHSDPAASSDLILMMRYGKKPGAAHGRPLKPVVGRFWQIEPGYPHFEGAEN